MYFYMIYRDTDTHTNKSQPNEIVPFKTKQSVYIYNYIFITKYIIIYL